MKYTLQLNIINHDNHVYYKERKNLTEDSGYDLVITEDYIFKPFERKYIGTGVRGQMLKDDGNEQSLVGYLLTPRSSINKTPFLISNSPGLIDLGYRGEYKLALFNCSDSTVSVKKGDRLGQLVAPNCEPFEVIFIDESELLDSKRGAKGFGSTG